MSISNSQVHLYDHSEAKVELYKKYLSIYLNVLARTDFIDTIYLYDLFCGEGIYKDGGEGSPIAALNCIKNHFFANSKSCPKMFVIFNDSEKSEIEPDLYKIERVKRFASSIFCPDEVKIGFSKIDYNILLPKVIERTARLNNNERALVFIDPWGYKEIDPTDIKKLLDNGRTEVILFLPTYFMSRFANKSKDKEYKGGRALRKFRETLFEGAENVPTVSSQNDFIYQTKEQFKKFLNIKYVDSFTIERGINNLFCIFFFTNNKRGFMKMLDAKWSIDKKMGQGFKIGNEVKLELFDELKISGYSDKVLSSLKEKGGLTNEELLDLGLENNFLPKHTKAVLDDIKKQHALEMIPLDGQPAYGYYLGNKKRAVKIKIK